MCTLPRLLTAGEWHSSPLIGRYINYKVAPGGCGCCWTGGGICRTSGDESDSLRWKLRRQRRRRTPTDRCRRDTTGVGCFAWVSPQRPQLQDVGNSVFSLIVAYLGLDLYIWFFRSDLISRVAAKSFVHSTCTELNSSMNSPAEIHAFVTSELTDLVRCSVCSNR